MLTCLRRLDARLSSAVDEAIVVFGEDARRDAFRGLHLGPDDAAKLFERPPGSCPLGRGDIDLEADNAAFAWLFDSYGLTPFEVKIVLIALAVEVDLRYELVFAYLQDDITRRRPTVELTLNLLCRDAAEKLQRRHHFAADAPLLRHRVIRLVPDPGPVEPPLLAHYVKLDEQIVDVLLGTPGLDRRLVAWCRLSTPTTGVADLGWGGDRAHELAGLLAAGRRTYLQGRPGCGRYQVAAAVAAELGRPLLRADLTKAPIEPPAFDEALSCFLREARLFGAIGYLDSVDAVTDAERSARLLDGVAETEGPLVLTGTRTWISDPRQPLGMVTVVFPLPSTADRRACWAAHLTGCPVTPADLDVLAERFPLPAGSIADAARTARGYTLAELSAAARAESGHELEALTSKVEPCATWDDLVLPEDGTAALREICGRVAGAQRVLNTWGFARKLARGTGVAALLAGPPGTGKTMAAEVISAELRLDLYRIDLAGVVSKYIGETEKNIDRIFAAAERSNAILLFDEAEALMGKRSEVRDAHDRYANIEVAYLLQRMESYRGLTLLATNLQDTLDPAFTRRLAFTVHFPLPDEANRRRIWRGIWPSETPLADDVDLDVLAAEFKLSGGNIKNIALAAAFLAETGPVSTAHVLHAIRREYQKMGKTLTEEELTQGAPRHG